VNQVKASRLFGTFGSPWITDGMTYDGNGWPTKDFGVILIGGGFVLPETTGTWYLSWTGNATVTPTATSASIVNQTYDPITNKGVAYVNMPGTEGNLMLSFATNGVGLKDLVVKYIENLSNFQAIRPGYSIANPPTFTTSFLSSLQGLNTIRYMDWAETNGNPIVTWSERSTPISAQSMHGAAYEYAIELANSVRANMWVNIPVMVIAETIFG
jgi:hypothetical protein